MMEAAPDIRESIRIILQHEPKALLCPKTDIIAKKKKTTYLILVSTIIVLYALNSELRLRF